MKILYYDCFSGISGDMHLAAMTDLIVPESYLLNELSKLRLHNVEISVEKGEQQGISGKKIKVAIQKNHSHHHRHLSDIAAIIEKSSLGSAVKEKSLAMFRRLAEAEAKIHGTTADNIHFHEVGAEDAIIDIVGAAICLDYIKPDSILCSAVELGSGVARCEHGVLPVPAPATVELLRNIPVTSGNQPFEATTPTGAVILACNVDRFVSGLDFSIDQTGYGLGNYISEKPNVLRVFLGTTENETGHPAPTDFITECNIDDMTPEHTGYLMERLFEAGADDVFITPVIMKKSRNAFRLTALHKRSVLEKIDAVLITETSTFGFRRYQVDKTELERDFVELVTKYGRVRIKRAFLNNKVVKQKPEYDDCVALAKSNNVPLQEVMREIGKLITQPDSL